jgi:hypothetical protein
MANAGRFEKLQRLYGGVALFTLNVLILFVVLNVLAWFGVRLYNRFVMLRTPLGKYHQEQILAAYPGWTWDQLLVLLCCELPYEYEPYTGHRNMPEKRPYLTVDEQGFRHVANQGPWPISKDFVNVFFFGGSTSFGSGLPDDQTIPSHLQAILNERLGGDRVRVYNFARVHYFSQNERILFERLVVEGIVPDYALFLDGLNDFHRHDAIPAMTAEIKELLRAQEVTRSKDRFALMLAPFRRMPVVTFANMVRRTGAEAPVAQDATRAELAAKYDVPGLVDAANRYVRNQALIRAVAQAEDVRTLFAIQPIPTYHYDLSHHVFSEGSLAYFNEANYAGFGYRHLAARKDELLRAPDFLWLADMQESRKENLYCDSIHYTSAFGADIAAAFADRLMPWIEQPSSGRPAAPAD